MNVDSFDFALPESLIAQTPLNDRSMSRLLSLNKSTGEIGHHTFERLLQFLQAGDAVVLNDTRVIPARLFGVKADTGAKIEVLLLRNKGGDQWEALVRPGKKVKKGTVLQFGVSGDSNLQLTGTVEEEGEMGARVLCFTYRGIFQEILDQLGQMPLPPYIKEQLQDKERYQTVYARTEGSAAAPTAGLHFTSDYLKEIEHKGISLAYVTLHVGLGTFRPVSVESVEEHKMHGEYYSISEEAADLLNRTRSRGGSIIAVGTTSARTLETAANRFGEEPIQACQGWTNIFIYPGYEFKIVNRLLTNFHLPKSTLLMLVSALAGRENVLKAYQEAIEREYRFFSFGDAMFIY